MSSQTSKIPYKPLIGVMAGGIFEFYDLVIFGLLATVVSPLFFPLESKILPILAGYITFAVGYFFRPLGSIVFGHIGDKYGRRIALYLSLLLMAISTLAIGIMPTYKSIGILSPCLVILARMLQGFSAGGELAGGLIFIMEHTNRLYKGLVAGLVWSGCNCGILLGSLTGLIFTLPNMPTWAWRVPFIIGFFIALAGLYIRSFIPESPAFIELKKNKKTEKNPLIKGFKCFYRQIVFSMLITIFFGFVFFFNIIVLPQVLIKTFSTPESLARINNILLLLFMTVSYPVFGFYADRFNKAKLAKVAITTLLTLTIGSLYIVYAKIPGILSTPLYHITAGIVMASYTSICQLFLINSFKETVRYSCFGVSYGIGMAVAATAPFLITFLMYGNNYITLIMLLASMGILAIFSVYGVEKLLFKTELCNKC